MCVCVRVSVYPCCFLELSRTEKMFIPSHVFNKDLILMSKGVIRAAFKRLI